MDGQGKPIICRLLRVEPEEEWNFGALKYRVLPSGSVEYFSREARMWGSVKNTDVLVEMLNHPESIEHHGSGGACIALGENAAREDAEKIRAIIPTANEIYRSADGTRLYAAMSGDWVQLDNALLPGLQDGETCYLLDILAG